jgi:hypothetical protein
MVIQDDYFQHIKETVFDTIGVPIFIYLKTVGQMTTNAGICGWRRSFHAVRVMNVESRPESFFVQIQLLETYPVKNKWRNYANATANIF